MMTKIRNFLLYFIYILLVASACFYYLFPSDAVKKYIAYQISKKNPKLQISMNTLMLTFPPGVKLTDVQLFHQNNPLVEAQHVNVYPLVWTFLSANKVISFNGASYDGAFNGTADIQLEEGNFKGYKIEADVKDITIQKIKAMNKAAAYKPTGVLGGKITYNESGSNQTLAADIKITEGGIEVATAVFNLKSIAFKTIDAKITVINHSQIQIEECFFKGNDLDGSISGSVQLNDPFSGSILNLNGMFKPHPPLIARLGSGFSLFLKRKPGDTSVGFRIGGTIGNPDFSIK